MSQILEYGLTAAQLAQYANGALAAFGNSALVRNVVALTNDEEVVFSGDVRVQFPVLGEIATTLTVTVAPVLNSTDANVAITITKAESPNPLLTKSRIIGLIRDALGGLGVPLAGDVKGDVIAIPTSVLLGAFGFGDDATLAELVIGRHGLKIAVRTEDSAADAKHEIHNLIILDESGSMESIKREIISGFNELVQSIRSSARKFPEQVHFISFVSFNSSTGNKVLHFVEPVENLAAIDEGRYYPNANTPLFDAIGFSVKKLQQHLEGKGDHNVIVSILTDGEENYSRVFSGRTIRELIGDLRKKGWTFTYIGTDHDIDKAADEIGIVNKFAFGKDPAGITQWSQTETTSRVTYYEKLDAKILAKKAALQAARNRAERQQATQQADADLNKEDADYYEGAAPQPPESPDNPAKKK
jgi:hypothetical protein